MTLTDVHGRVGIDAGREELSQVAGTRASCFMTKKPTNLHQGLARRQRCCHWAARCSPSGTLGDLYLPEVRLRTIVPARHNSLWTGGVVGWGGGVRVVDDG